MPVKKSAQPLKNRLRTGWPLFALALAVFWFCGPDPAEGDRSQHSAGREETVDPVFQQVILTVQGKPYRNLDFRDYYQVRYARLQSQAFAGEVLRSIFEQFVSRTLLLTRLREEGFTVAPGDVERYVKSFKTSPQTRVEEIKNDFLIQKYLVDRVYRDIEVSESEILDYYQKHRSDYRRKEQVLVYQIKTNTSQEALEIRHLLLKDPDRFEELARERSVSQDARDGGRMGYFEKGTLPKVIEDTVFSRRRNDLSQIVETPYGFHIFKVTDRKRPGTLPLYQVSEEIQKILYHEKISARKQELIESLKKRYQVQEDFASLYLLDEKFKQSKGASVQ